MKSFVFPIILGLSAFLAGSACALYVAKKFEAHAWHESIVAGAQETPWFQQETESQIRLSNIEAAQHGDTQKIIHLNCLLLKIGLPAVRPERFGPTRVADVKAFQERARSVISSLEQQGLCSFGSPPSGTAVKP